MTYSNILPPLTVEERRAQLCAAFERAKENLSKPRPAPPPVNVVSAAMYKFMQEQGWVDENGYYTKAFYRGE